LEPAHHFHRSDPAGRGTADSTCSAISSRTSVRDGVAG
jgi:hypothetical protein